MTLIQLNPPLPLRHIEKGNCLAHFLIDYGPESELYFIVFFDSTGEIWTYSNRVLKACKNITLGRTFENPITNDLPESTNSVIEWIKWSDKEPKIGQSIITFRSPYPSSFWLGIYIGVPTYKDDIFDFWYPVPPIPKAHWEEKE